MKNERASIITAKTVSPKNFLFGRGAAIKTILTHKQPDLDAIVSAWLAQKYLFAGEQTTVVFVRRNLARAQMETADCVVDVGNTYDPQRQVVRP